MKVLIQAHSVWDAVGPKDPKATIEKRTDKIALDAICQGIPEDMLLSIVKRKTTKETWEEIKTLCLCADRVKKERVQILKSEFESLSMKDTEDLDDFYMKLYGLVTNI